MVDTRKKKDMENNTKEILFNKKEITIVALFTTFMTVLSAVLMNTLNLPENLVDVVELQVNTSYILPALLLALVSGSLLTFIPIFFKLPSAKPNVKSTKYWIIYGILFFLGIIAFEVIFMGLISLSVSKLIAGAVAMVIFSIYLYLMLKMYIYGYITHKGLFYEVIRFSLVGVIAALFDFTTCAIFQYLILPSNWPDIALTIVSVTFGFMVGVFVNYICSVYMVFKNTTDKNTSRTTKGRVLFVLLASVGLFMGYGFQYLFFDFLELGYLLSFVLRTLIVLVWNYLSRKFFIFK